MPGALVANWPLWFQRLSSTFTLPTAQSHSTDTAQCLRGDETHPARGQAYREPSANMGLCSVLKGERVFQVLAVPVKVTHVEFCTTFLTGVEGIDFVICI